MRKDIQNLSRVSFILGSQLKEVISGASYEAFEFTPKDFEKLTTIAGRLRLLADKIDKLISLLERKKLS